MTQEEKAKAYDEALNEIRELISLLKKNDVITNNGIIESNLKRIFPALKENEDEKIKSCIRDVIKENDWSHIFGVKKEDCLAYLEKQKKQKPIYNLEIPAGDVAPAEEEGPFDEDEFLENELSAFLQNYDKEYDDDTAVSDVARHFYEIGKKQKPAEWSEEDNRYLISAINIVADDFGEDYGTVRWLKAIPGRVNPQPKQEWSAEDERMLNVAIKSCEQTIEDFPNDNVRFNECITWLKSLRSQYHWKPSEDEERLIKTSISFLKDFADNGYENAVECIDWLKSKLNGNSC